MKINRSHYLLGCRFDNWLYLLRDNHFLIEKGRRAEVWYISFISLILYLPAVLEKLIYDRRIKETEITRQPLYVLGHWRSGTTYIQNILSQDPQFAWCDPVNTATISNCILLKGVLEKAQAPLLKTARPMDNMKYDIHLPLEDAFGLATISPYTIIHMIAFPHWFEKYIPCAFVEDLPEKERAVWRDTYLYMLKKLTYLHDGKQLMPKSPDNTAHVPALLEMFPGAKFVNIYRDPYTTVLSTIHMFEKQMDVLAIGPKPEGNFSIMLEDTVLYIFERMYRELFEVEKTLSPDQYISVRYEDFVKAPTVHLRKVYEALGLSGFEEALPRFEAYVENQQGYVKNRFQLNDRLREKINSRLGFYFEHYGYAMEEE